MRKAAPVEYVRVCTAYGAGFFYIPGTDTCLRVGGRARFEYQYTNMRTRANSVSGFRSLGRLNIDARTATPYGTLRAFVRFEIASRTGTPYMKSVSTERQANAFSANGADTYSQMQKFVDVDKAFVQFAGITAGRAQSFYDFYAGDLELIGAGLYSNSNTNLLAYTATFGAGFSVTASMEDPTYRRAPVFYQGIVGAANAVGAAGTAPAAQAAGVNFITSAVPVTFVGTGFNAAGVPVAAQALDSTQRVYMPDFVGALRYDGSWGSAQIAGAVHEIRLGTFSTGPGTFPVNGGGAATTVVAPRIPDAAYGFAVQGGLKINLPQLAPGDQLWLQGAYAQGAGTYTGVFGPTGYDSLTSTITARFTMNAVDAVVDSRSRVTLTESFSVTAALLHYWSPEIRQAVFGTYGQVNFDPRLRTALGGPAGVTGGAAAVNPFNPTLMSYDIFYGGSNLIWSPIRDLDIGVEVVYYRIDPLRRVADANRGGIAAINGTTVTGTGRTTTTDDNIMGRLRIQRDF